MSFLGLNLFNRIAIWIDSKNVMFLWDFLDIDYCRGSQTLFAWRTQNLSLKIFRPYNCKNTLQKLLFYDWYIFLNSKFGYLF